MELAQYIQIKKGSVLISAFPGTGKSFYTKHAKKYYPRNWCTDSDSSKFDKSKFPENYITHIKNKIESNTQYIFISSHKIVRDALVNNNLDFVLVYPDMSLKQEYIERYKLRGNNEDFIKLLENKWEEWINECQEQEGCLHVVLKSNQFIKDVL